MKKTSRKLSRTFKSLSLHPLPPEEALRLFMQVKPEKIKARVKRPKAGKGKVENKD
jgi:hypothetical protein